MMARRRELNPTPVLLCMVCILAGGVIDCATGEGPWVRHVVLKGARQLDPQEILDGLALRDSCWWWWTTFCERRYYERAQLDRDVQRIESYYVRHGFMGARVVARKVTPVKDGEAVDIRLTVEEGPPTSVAEVRVSGLEGVQPPERRQRLRDLVSVRPGQRYSHAAYGTSKRAIAGDLSRRAYPYAKVDGQVQVARAERRARVEIEVKPGPSARFGKTTFKQTGPIPLDKLRRLIDWKEGQPFDRDAVSQTRRRLTALQVFSSVQIEIPREPLATIPITIKAPVGKLRALSLGGGFGLEPQRHEIHLLGRWTLRNFFGGLRTFTLEVRPAYVVIPTLWNNEQHGPAIDVETRLEQPDVFDTAIALFAMTGYELDRQHGYTSHGPRVQLGGARLFWRDCIRLSLSWNLKYLSYNIQDSQAFDQTETPLGVEFGPQTPYRLAYLEQVFRLDLRDQPLDPRSGFWAELRAEQGLEQVGGRFSYFKLTPELRGYLPLGTKRIVLALRARYGYMRGFGVVTPITRRYYLGGPTDHRGFSYGRLSPFALDKAGDLQSRHFPTGGNSALLFSADLRLRLVRLAGNWLGFQPFVDAGDAVTDPGDLNLGRLHWAVGGELVYQTPIGAVRASVGFRLNRRERTADNPDPDQPWAPHLTLGGAF